MRTPAGCAAPEPKLFSATVWGCEAPFDNAPRPGKKAIRHCQGGLAFGGESRELDRRSRMRSQRQRGSVAAAVRSILVKAKTVVVIID